MMDLVANTLPIYTPDGNVADPNHPLYAIVWIIVQLLGGN